MIYRQYILGIPNVKAKDISEQVIANWQTQVKSVAEQKIGDEETWQTNQ